jgi:hypothetical protein
MTDFEYLQIVLQIAHLRANTRYRDAELMRRSLGKYGAAEMAKAAQTSAEYHNIRLLIATWNRISIFANHFSAAQLRKFFKCHPISLTWKVLEPGVTIIRNADKVPEPVHKHYARELEELAAKYDKWTKTPDGKDYRSEAQQAVCADFG